MYLDDLKYIHEKDVHDTLGIAARQGQQLLHEFEFTGTVKQGGLQNIVYSGMGGSALAASMVHTWPTVNIPFELVRDYEIPAYTGPDTLFFASSYSGNTEETLSALAEAEARGARIVVITSGGKLQQIAEEKGYLLALIPKAEQPRYAVFYNLKALLLILEKEHLLKEDFRPAVERAAAMLERVTPEWAATVPSDKNPAKQLARELIGKSVVVYGGPKMYPAAYKWKISFNENAKQVAWVGQLPEFNHNEFIGWSEQPTDKPYAVIDLRSNMEHPRVQKRFEVSARMLSGRRPEPHVVQAEGETILEELLWMVAFGDFVSLYAGLLNGLDPAPVDLVERFKKALDE